MRAYSSDLITDDFTNSLLSFLWLHHVETLLQDLSDEAVLPPVALQVHCSLIVTTFKQRELYLGSTNTHESAIHNYLLTLKLETH